MKSIYQNLGGIITMPTFSERKLYMHKTKMNEIILPEGFKDYSHSIENILRKVKNRNNVCYITIDEKRISNETHRRSGIHVDFNWFEGLNAHNDGGGSGGHKMDGKNGGILLVSNYAGCKVYKGEFSGEIGEGGCCKGIDVSKLQSEVMKPHEVYFVNALGIHESLKIQDNVNRTLIRINFHPDYIFN